MSCGRAPGPPLTRAPLLIAIGRVLARWARQTMKWLFGASLVTVTVLIVTTTVSIQAFADSCTERQRVCFAYCQKAESNTPQCPAACRGYLTECLSTGCWESRVSAKRCGFDRREPRRQVWVWRAGCALLPKTVGRPLIPAMRSAWRLPASADGTMGANVIGLRRPNGRASEMTGRRRRGAG